MCNTASCQKQKIHQESRKLQVMALSYHIMMEAEDWMGRWKFPEILRAESDLRADPTLTPHRSGGGLDNSSGPPLKELSLVYRGWGLTMGDCTWRPARCWWAGKTSFKSDTNYKRSRKGPGSLAYNLWGDNLVEAQGSLGALSLLKVNLCRNLLTS